MSARLHLIYSDLIYNCLSLSERDALRIAELHTVKPFQFPSDYKVAELAGYKASIIAPCFEVDRTRYASPTYSDIYFQGIRSIPSVVEKLLACDYLSKKYDLEGVPGFYSAQGIWRLNLYGKGLLKPYRNNLQITGLFIYQSHLDPSPKLLSSEGLYRGTSAIQPEEQTERLVA